MLDPFVLLHVVFDRIEDYLQAYSKSRKVCLDYKTRKLIEHRFFIKLWEGSNCHAHICIIYDKKKCIAVGMNSIRQHAEVDALKKFLPQYINATPRRYFGMIIVRFSKTGLFNNSSPCFHCSSFLRKNLDYFHSISFSDVRGSLCILTSDRFREETFHHISRGHLRHY